MDEDRGRLIVVIVFIVGVVIWMTVFSSRIADLRRLSTEYDQAERTIAALTATTSYLATEVKEAGSDAAVERWAYEERNWIRDGDQRLAIIPLEGTPAAASIQPTPTPTPENMFRVWWELFFDSGP
jgi:hypothetical protein